MVEGVVAVNGVRLWYEDRGDPGGEAVVLITGAGATALAWPPRLLDALTGAGLRVVRFDHRDIGRSTHVDATADPYTIDDLAADTVGLLDALAVDRAHLVGVSMGGMVSQLVALRHPRRVRSLNLLITTPGPDGRLAPPSDRLAAVGPDPADLWRALAGRRFPFDEAHHRAHDEADRVRGTNPGHAHSVVVLTAPSRLEALAAVAVPTLVVHGSEDPVFPLDHGEALARAVPGARLVVWEGVGHELPEPLVGDLAAALLANMARRT